ncbi:MAG: toprim domain-containing protein, partial [Gammaproteobacteria bacterium]
MARNGPRAPGEGGVGGRHHGTTQDSTRAADQFAAAMRARGLTPPEIIEPGKLHRFSSNGRARDDGGWYVFHDDGIPAGAFGDWRTGVSQTWRADIGRELTPREEADHRARMDAMRRERKAEQARRHAEARAKARSLWKAATPAQDDHPYLVRKGVSPLPSLREIDAGKAAAILDYAPKSRDEPLTGRLLVVQVEVAGELSTVELIDEVGFKSAIFGGAKVGGYWAAQPLPEGDGDGLTLLIGEGVATVLSAREATGHLVFAALSCGNLLAVAAAMRARYLKATIVILADLGNGQKKATEAAQAVG